jgi:hypothetical protein
MKTFLKRWHDVTEREFPELVHLIPSPDEVDMNKLEGGSSMTDTCATAQKCNRLLCASVDGVVHELYCYNHLRNVWVKNVLLSLNDFLRAHLHDSLDEIAPEFRVSASFIALARAFDKEFSLTANYPKGHGEIFNQWMKETHPGELLFHVERAVKGGRQDVASMAAMAMYWNRNYCLEFMEDMLRLCGKEDNILINNLFFLLGSVEIIAATRLWSILHVSIVMPIRWLSANVHTLGEYGWGVISLGRVLDKLKGDLDSIIKQPELVHDEEFMMGLMDEWRAELPPFDDYLKYQFEEKETRVVGDSGATVVPLKMLVRELFHPRDQDNKDSTEMLEMLAPVMASAWTVELTDEKKATWQFLSESGSSLSWDHCPDDVKEALKGMMAVNDLAESSFAGVTAQVQVYGRIGMSNAAGVSDLNRNGFLSPVV